MAAQLHIPFEPESIESARARLWKALEKVFNAHIGDSLSVLPRKELRRYVFDFDDGLRMIVTRDIEEPGNPPVVHVSCSVVGDEAVARVIAGGRDAYLLLVRQRWEQLGRAPLRFVNWDHKGVPHLIEEYSTKGNA